MVIALNGALDSVETPVSGPKVPGASLAGAGSPSGNGWRNFLKFVGSASSRPERKGFVFGCSQFDV